LSRRAKSIISTLRSFHLRISGTHFQPAGDPGDGVT